jgi:hypothetical protein
MVYRGVTDLRTRPRVAQYNVAITADTDIFTDLIENQLENTKTKMPDESLIGISFYTIQFVPQAIGKLMIVKKNGAVEYLTNPDNDWPAGLPILVTYMMSTDDAFNLRYSASTTASTIVITEHGGVY